MSNEARGKYEFTKPAEVRETKSLRLGLHVHQGDAHARVPGGLYGSANLLDDAGNIVTASELQPEDLAEFEAGFSALRESLLRRIGATFVEAPAEEVAEAETAEAAEASK